MPIKSRHGFISLSVVVFLTAALKRSDLKSNFEPSCLIMSSQGATEGNICTEYYYCFKIHLILYLVTLPVFSVGSGANPSNSAKSSSSNHPSEQCVLQIRVDVAIPVPAAWRLNGYHERLRDLFMTTYKNEQRFQMSLQGLGTNMWRVEGRVKFNKKCQLKSARKRIKGVFMDCHDSLQPSLNESDAFNQHLAKFLNVKPDDQPFSGDGDTHSWTVVESAGASQRQLAPAAPPARPPSPPPSPPAPSTAPSLPSLVGPAGHRRCTAAASAAMPLLTYHNL